MSKVELENFECLVEDLEDFKEDFNSQTNISVGVLEAYESSLENIWERCQSSFDKTRSLFNKDKDDSVNINELRMKYRRTSSQYIVCKGLLRDKLHALTHPSPHSSQSSNADLVTPQNTQHRNNGDPDTPSFIRHPPSFHGIGIRVAPCDIDNFDGTYESWPKFRDMFTAMFIEERSFSNVQRLFYLNQKTKGEAKEIVSRVDLTNDGFVLAWKNLVDRYENRRRQINGQLRILFNLPQVQTENGPGIKQLQMTVNNCIYNLSRLDVKTEHWYPILIYLCSVKLPTKTLQDFESTIDDNSKVPSWEDFDKFLSQRFQSLESVGDIKLTHPTHPKPSFKQNDRNIKSFHTNVSQPKNSYKAPTQIKKPDLPKSQYRTQIICNLCKGPHNLRECENLLKMSVEQRIGTIKTLNCCFNCFAVSHTINECKSRYSCRHCGKRHNSLLHKNNTNQPSTENYYHHNTQAQPIASTSAQAAIRDASHSSQTFTIQSTTQPSIDTPFIVRNHVILGTAMVIIENSGAVMNVRALIDSGSEASFISEKIRRDLDLPVNSVSSTVTGLAQTQSATPCKISHFTLKSPVCDAFKLEASALVLKTLTGDLPTYPIEPKWELPLSIKPLADTRFYESRSVDMIIGSDIYSKIMLRGLKTNILGSLLAQNTIFGWILSGPLPTSSPHTQVVSLFNKIHIDELLTRFWEVEEVPRNTQSEEDKYCEELYKKTTHRNTAGRYVVSLPFRNSTDIELGTSKSSALAQFLRNERSLSRRPDIKDEYNRVIKEYLDIGHMRKLSNSGPNCTSQYFLPHHAVIRPDKLTTKLRVVFNASSPTSNRKSLNDILYPGPILQSDLVILILRWRQFKFVFNADIQKMYRQILVNPQHTPYQRILFRESDTHPVQEYELQTVTFGVNCAPYLAIRTLFQLASEYEKTHLLAAQIIRQNMYVDDVLAGGHDIHSAKKALQQLSEVMNFAGFPLRKWISNNPTILSGVPNEHKLDDDVLNLADENSPKTLGIRWNASKDIFFFLIPPVTLQESYSKREVLSSVAKLFDPAGWLAPIIITAKIIMQQIWLDKTNWDEGILPSTLNRWLAFLNGYKHINSIKIPRWTHFTPQSKIQLHGFSDASEKAYAASIYLRVQDPDGSVYTTLLMSKTRVAPVKTISIPRLELCGATLLAKLIDAVIPHIQLTHYTLHCWTDSTIVLAWLKKPACSWTTFVANRVSEINDKVGVDHWKHVDSHDNPADLASRGCTASDLGDCSLWWHGPKWLSAPEDSWLSHTPTVETNLESKPIKAHLCIPKEDILARFSSLTRAMRVLSYVHRFFMKSSPERRSTVNYLSEELSSSELEATRTRLILISQKLYFSEEYHALSQRQVISSKSTILSLNPFIDTQGVLRANGRLVKSMALTYNERHPIILSYGSHFAKLLTEFTHVATLHGGNQLVLRTLRCSFWILKAKNLIKTIIHNCKTCTLYRKRQQTQLMAALPSERSTFSRPFTYTGLDFAGPFEIRNFTGRACLITKGYVCVFVCFATKAIHLEPVSDLSSQAFLAAFSRFCARRGCPNKVYSDNGTNFQGASSMLKKDRIDFLKQVHNSVITHYSQHCLEWHFIPPGAPHMGGLWEAGVKSFKTHLKRVAAGHRFTFEELSTLLSRIESCLNSRPLSPSSEQCSELNALTPGHFLIGTPILAPPEPNVNDINTTIQNRWQKLKVLHHIFSRRWKDEYLKELHKRYKWKNPQRNVELDDLVVVRRENTPPHEWRLGRVIKVYPGSDRRTRVVDIRTAVGTVTRPITKVVVLASD